MANVHRDLGPVSAYAIAVKYGYKGTEEEWAELQIASAENAKDADASAKEAAETLAAVEQTVAEEKNQAVEAIAAREIEAVEAVEAQESASAQAVQEAAEAAGTAQEARIAAKGEQTLQSIPEEYTKLEQDVAALTEEITDVHTGYDGTIYPSAGSAVREQIRRLHDEKNKLITRLEDYSPAVGSVAINNGEYRDSYTNRIVNQDLIPVKIGDKITTYAGYAFNVFKFDSDGNYTGCGTYGYTEYTVDWDGYLRIAVGYDKTINIADYAMKVGSVGTSSGAFLPKETSGLANRVANEELIPVKAGDKIAASNGYAFNVFKFDSDGNYTGCGTYGYTEYTVDWDGYLRIAVGSVHDDMTDYVDAVCNNMLISCIVQDMTDYADDACANTSIKRDFDVHKEVIMLKQAQEKTERKKYVFNYPYNLDRLYVVDYESMEDIKDLTPGQFHAKMKELCDIAPGYATQTLLGNDVDGNPLYKYVLEPNVPYINCSRNENLVDRPIDGVKIDTPTIIIVSGIHGIEASNDYAVYNLLKNLLTNRNDALDFIFRNLRLVIVPACCPSGELAYTYQNSSGINVNRDFPLTQDGTTQSPEAGYIKSVIDTYTDAIALIDMHTHRTKDIMSWNYTDDDVFMYVATRIASELTHAWIDKYPDVEFDTGHDSYNPYTKVWVYNAPNAENTSSTYASRVWGIPAGTIEMRRTQPITNVLHGLDAVAFSYDVLVNFIISFCRTIS